MGKSEGENNGKGKTFEMDEQNYLGLANRNSRSGSSLQV